MAFEKEKKMNALAMAAGVILAAAGLIIYFTFSKIAGILLLIAGVAIFVITMSISSVFYRIKMIELFEGRKMNNK